MPPMDDASSVPPQDDMMPPTDGQNIGAGTGMEPQGAGMDMGADLNPIGDDMGSEGSGDDTMSKFNELSDEDKEAARKYIESMLSRDETQQGENGGEGMPENGGMPQMPMESFIFTKGQLNKLNEAFGDDLTSDKEEKPNEKKMNNKGGKKSPFDSPSFNKK